MSFLSYIDGAYHLKYHRPNNVKDMKALSFAPHQNITEEQFNLIKLQTFAALTITENHRLPCLNSKLANIYIAYLPK